MGKSSLSIDIMSCRHTFDYFQYRTQFHRIHTTSIVYPTRSSTENRRKFHNFSQVHKQQANVFYSIWITISSPQSPATEYIVDFYLANLSIFLSFCSRICNNIRANIKKIFIQYASHSKQFVSACFYIFTGVFCCYSRTEFYWDNLHSVCNVM